MKAGQLEIEIVAEIAKLQQSMRDVERTVGKTAGQIGRDARAANDNLRNIGRGAGQGVQQFSRNVAQLKAQLDPAWAAAQRFKQQQLLLNQAFREGAISSKELVTQLRANAAAFQSAGTQAVGTSNAMRAGFQNAGYQISDFAVQVGGGTSAIRAASQQAPQLIQALGMMGAGADGAKGKFAAFTAFMGGPWGAALTVAISILGALATAYYNSADASDTKKDATEDLVDAINELNKATVRESQSTWASIQTDIDKANSLRLRAIEARKAAIAELELAKARAEGAGQSISPGAPGYSNAFNLGEQAKQEANARTIQKRIEEQQALVEKANETIRLQRGQQTQLEVAAQFDTNAAATLKYDKALDGLNNRLRTGAISQAEYKQQLIAITAAREAEAESGRKSERSSRQRTARLTDEQKAVVQQTKATDRYIESLSDEIARIGLDEKALRQLEVTREMSAAQTLTEKNVIAALNVVRERAIALAEAEAQAKANKDTERDIARMKAELGLIELTGIEREKMALTISEEAEVTAVLVKIKKAEADQNTALIAQLERQIELIHEKYGIERQGIGIKKGLEDEADAAEILNGQLREMIYLLGEVGSVGSVLGGLLGVLTGNTYSVGGKLGDLLNIPTGQNRYDEKLGREIGVTIGDELSGLFDKDSDFGKAMQSLVGGAGTGLVAGNAFFGRQNTAEQIGSALGGIAGQVAGEAIGKAIGGIAGKFGGPLGAIAGGVFGGFLGGLLSPNRTARANITGPDSVSLAGKDGKNYGAAESLAGSVLQGLQDIADAFGGAIGSFNTTIGVRGGDFRVNTSGTSLKKKNGALDFEDDAQAAIAYAIADAIADGAIIGIRESTKRLIEFGDDVQRQLEKALQFEGVFSELKAETDPLGYALDNLAKQFNRLEDIFAEAGATAEEYAQLEQLLEIKRKEAIESATKDLVADFQERADLEVQLLSLLGKETKALALARESELLGVKDTLKPLQQMVYQLQDARAIIDQFGPLADGLREFKAELLGGSSAGGFAFLRGQFNSTAAAAAGGDAAALAKLQEVSTEYLEAARANASSRLEYDRAVGEVLGAVDQGIFAADAQVEYAQMQIDAVNYNSEILDKMRAEMAAMQQRLVEQGETAERIMKRWEGNGMPIRADSDEPLAVQVIS